MNILGISCFYHDSACALVRDGDIIAAAQEERFTRKKHDSSFPKNAIDFCLNSAQLRMKDIDYIAFYDKPFIKFERILETYLAYAPSGLKSFLMSIPLWIKEKLWMSELIKKECTEDYSGKYIFSQHHLSHAASAFFPSPFEESAILTTDGVGEWTTTSFGVGKANNVSLDYELKFPHSLGLLYSAFTYYAGFKVNSAEYKVMGLAPYGQPKYTGLILDNLIDLKEDGSFKLNMKYFNYCAGLTMTNDKFHRLFDGPPRRMETPIRRKDMDLAASIQKVTEEIMLRIARHVKTVTGQKNLCLAGGVSLNCVANGKILREKIFDNIWIQPAAGDAGGALGAALFTWYQYLNNTRSVNPGHDSQKGSLLGPEFPEPQIQKFLQDNNIKYSKYKIDEIPQITADLIKDQNVIGWFQARMEYGPRALGARSILGDARSEKMQSIINRKIKFRESFRPFAPSVLKEHASEYFDIDTESPYMLLVAPVNSKKCRDLTEDQKHLTGIDKLNVKRSDIPAVTHVDFSARVQTVDQVRNPMYYKLIKAFYEKTGCPVIINTSFNVRGEPIVCTPRDAYRCFMRTNMDYLVMGNFILDKKQQPPVENKEEWQQEFPLD